MPRFEHQRHKSPQLLARTREIVVVCAPMRSNINISRIVRACGCCGVQRLICTGTAKVIDRIARDGADTVDVETHRSLAPVLTRLRDENFRLVGLEQTTRSQILCDYAFHRRSALVVGNERQGLGQDVLDLLDDVVEIPMYGMPFSHNAATAAAIALYEYCRQFPAG